jgi:hypothetical protein
MGLDGQTRLGFGIVDIVETQIERAQRTPRPRFAHFAKQPMFDRIPLGSSRRIMTDGDGQSERVGQFLLDLLFKNATA